MADRMSRDEEQITDLEKRVEVLQRRIERMRALIEAMRHPWRETPAPPRTPTQRPL